MKKNNSEPTIGVIVGNREFFPTELAVRGGKKVVESLKGQGLDVVTVFSEEGKGLAENRDDSKKYAELFNEKDLDGILVTLPNFGDEKSAVETIKLTEKNVPLMIHAFPDDLEKMDRKHRRDSFCGKLSVCNNLYQAQIPFTNTEKHVEDPDSEEFERDIDKFRRICNTVTGINNARLGVIGLRPNPFQTVRYSEKILEANGISLETISLMEAIEQTRALDEEESQVEERLEEIKNTFTLGDITDEAVTKTAKLTVFMSNWIQENDLDTVSFQCWPEIEEYYGISPCGALSLLSESMIPGACESDVMGSLSMYALSLASNRPAALIDLNNNYGNDPNKMVAFHCSNFPKSFFQDEECTLGYHEMQETYGSCSGRIASGPATFLRITTDDSEGKIKAYVAEGEYTDDEIDSFGGYGVVKIEGLQVMLDTIAKKGFEHHAATVHGHVADVLEEALENYLNWRVYKHSVTEEEFD